MLTVTGKVRVRISKPGAVVEPSPFGLPLVLASQSVNGHRDRVLELSSLLDIKDWRGKDTERSKTRTQGLPPFQQQALRFAFGRFGSESTTLSGLGQYALRVRNM